MKWVNFFSELKRCNVYKVAITYAVVAGCSSKRCRFRHKSR